MGQQKEYTSFFFSNSNFEIALDLSSQDKKVIAQATEKGMDRGNKPKLLF